MVSKFFFNVLLNIFQIQIKFVWSTMYVNLLGLCVAIYFFRGQFTSVIYSVSSTSAFIARQMNHF